MVHCALSDIRYDLSVPECLVAKQTNKQNPQTLKSYLNSFFFLSHISGKEEENRELNKKLSHSLFLGIFIWYVCVRRYVDLCACMWRPTSKVRNHSQALFHLNQ